MKMRTFFTRTGTVLYVLQFVLYMHDDIVSNHSLVDTIRT